MSVDSKKSKRIAAIRRDYGKQELSESSVRENPLDQFAVWFEQAMSADLLDANAMTLSTVSEDGQPSSRIVLLKGIDEKGIRFYTNYESQKGREIQQNPKVAACFYWAPLERQVRIEGEVERLSRSDSKVYFEQRPRLSQIGAWASKQSSRVDSREELEDQFAKIKARFEGRDVPLPDFWGGYLLMPRRIEFWQGREGRLHDRICYEKEGESWKNFRLAP